MSKFNFKPFDKVVVRDGDGDKWKIEFFEREDKDDESYPYVCMHYRYKECVPYNEETKHLLGTNKPYIPVEDEATKYSPGEIVEISDTESGWIDAIYLEFQETPFPAHKVYTNETGVCVQLLTEIRKKVK